MLLRQMDLSAICSFILLQSSLAVQRNLAIACRSRVFSKFCQKSISDFWHRCGGVGSLRDLSKNPTPDFLGEAKQMDLADFFKF